MVFRLIMVTVLSSIATSCNRAIARLLQNSPAKPDIALYANDAKTVTACLEFTDGLIIRKPATAREALMRASLIVQTVPDDLPALLDGPPFVTLEESLARLQHRLRVLGRQLRDSEKNMQNRIDSILPWGDRTRVYPSSGGDFFVHEDGI